MSICSILTSIITEVEDAAGYWRKTAGGDI